MYYVKKTLEVSGAHWLELPYDSKCKNLHGHNWQIDIYLKGKSLNPQGMLEDFTVIKDKVMKLLDHRCVNETIPGMNPTAENIARFLCEEYIGDMCYRVDITESEGNWASYERCGV